MRSSFALDRYVAILARVRACLGILYGLVILAICIVAISGLRQTTPQVTPSASNAEVRGERTAPNRVDPEARRAARRARLKRSLDRLGADTGRVSFGIAAGLFFIALPVFEFVIAGSIRRGERRGFISEAVVAGIGSVLGLLSDISRPVAGYWVVFSLTLFVYCISRISGVGPKPA